MNSRFKEVLKHLEKLPRDFFGEVKIRFREGKPVMMFEERTRKLEDDKQERR